MIAPEHAAALVIAVALLIGAVIVIAVEDFYNGEPMPDDELGPRVPAPRPDYEAGIQAMDAMGREANR